MSKVDVATLKERADEFVEKAIAGHPTIIEQNGKRAVLLRYPGETPDFLLNDELDRFLTERSEAPGLTPADKDWETLRASIPLK